MSLQIKILIMAVVAAMIIGLINMVRRKKLNLKYAFPWLFLAVGVGVFTLCDPLTSALARLLGIEIPSNMIFFLGFCFSLTIIFGLTLAVSALSGRVKRLTQEIALMEKEMEQLSKLSAEKLSAEKLSAEKLPEEKPSAEILLEEKPSVGNLPVEKPSA